MLQVDNIFTEKRIGGLIPTAISRTKAGISYAFHNGRTIDAIGFGWCWDPYGDNVSAGTDPVTGNHWYGWSEGSSTGTDAWGIDDADNAVTGNAVNMDNYLEATQEYIDYVADSIPTVVFFTTGPVDSYDGYFSAEARYQGHLKYEHIRNYVAADSTRILFDYADILCHDDNGQVTNDSWNGNTFPTITSTNLTPTIGFVSHIQAGL
jgi:hypothetical protein